MVLAIKVTSNFAQQKFGQAQQQILNLSKISVRKEHGQFSTER